MLACYFFPFHVSSHLCIYCLSVFLFMPIWGEWRDDLSNDIYILTAWGRSRRLSSFDLFFSCMKDAAIRLRTLAILKTWSPGQDSCSLASLSRPRRKWTAPSRPPGNNYGRQRESATVKAKSLRRNNISWTGWPLLWWPPGTREGISSFKYGGRYEKIFVKLPVGKEEVDP